MSRVSSGVYGGVSAEDRHSERRRKLLDAGLELIATEGWPATSVRRVCQQAGLTYRFFYESFDTLDALGVAVVDEIAAETIANLVPALAANYELPDRIRAGVTALVTTLTDDPRKARVAFVEALGSGPVMRRRLAIMQTVAGILAAEFTRTDPSIEDQPFVYVAALGVAGLFVELVIEWTNGEVARSRDELIIDIADLVLANIDGAIVIARRRAHAR